MMLCRELTEAEVIALALANGFKLKVQPNGSMALNPYVFNFVKALFEAARIQQTQEREPNVHP